MKRRLIWAMVLLMLAGLTATLIPPAVTLARHLAGQITIPVEGLRRDATAARDETGVDMAPILAFAPFGLPVQTATATQTSPSASRLDLTLSGVLVAPKPQDSRALIVLSGAAGFHRIGDELTADAVLVEITSDKVGVEINAEVQYYGFEGLMTDDPQNVATAEVPEAKQTGSAADRFASSVVPGRGSLDLREGPPPESTQEYIALWRQRIIENPNNVLATIGLEPGSNGYTIKENPNIGVTLAGLKTGDVVTRVNGQTVGDPAQDQKYYDEIAASGHARLEVVRDGEKILMSFPLR
ncbi:type II secretion system protein N [Pseudooceanicola sp. MF1-13]|uniref:type II secretion system protein N n=1 Tax=Pseudooceanicola sp. MF1-13 TaxID=3379095 RepID=UPI0038917BC8